MSVIEREITSRLPRLFRQYPFVVVTGPRQAGKTTLCRSAFGHLAYRSLDALDVRAFAESDPRGFLAETGVPAVIDEIQNVPSLLTYLKEDADAGGGNGRYILTGSENLTLAAEVSESLAGRAALVRLLPFSLAERRRAGASEALGDIVFGGFYPRIIDQRLEPRQALRDYFETYVERDVRRMGGVANLSAFARFTALCAGRVGQLLSLTSLSDDVGVSRTTIREWLTLLERCYVVHLLPPFARSVRKRLVKSPKLYFHDVGLASYLIGIESPGQVTTHPLRGQLFENIVVSEALKHGYNRGRDPRLSFFRDSRGLECDLFYETERGINAIEAKSGSTVSASWFRSFEPVAREVPDVIARTVVYAGAEEQTRSAGDVLPLGRFDEALRRFDADMSVSVNCGGAPVAGADVLALFPNKTWQRAGTDDSGMAHLKLYTTDAAMTVFVAAEGFSAAVVDGWVPAEGPLQVELQAVVDGGSVIFADQTGYVPGLEGRLNPILDTSDRMHLYATNVAIDGGRQQPAGFTVGGAPLNLVDAHGNELDVRVVAMLGQSALLDYRRPPAA